MCTIIVTHVLFIFKNFLKFIGVQLTYNAVLFLLQRQLYQLYIHICPLFFQVLFPYGSFKVTEQSSLCYTIGPRQLFVFFLNQLQANYFTILQWFLSYIDMNQPWIYMYSPSRSHLPPPSPPDPSGSSQCTRPEHLSHCIQLGLVICFTLDNIHVPMLFS